MSRANRNLFIPETLIDTIAKKALPWVETRGTQNLIVAQPTFEALTASVLPKGARVTRTNLKGKRVSLRGSESFASSRVVSAHYPESGVEVKRSPMLVFVIAGETAWPVSDYILHCPAGQIILIPAGIPSPDGDYPHLDASQGDGAYCDLLWFLPRGDWIHCTMCHSQGDRHWKKPEEWCDIRQRQALAYYEDFVHEAVKGDAYHDKISQALLISFLCVIQREMEAGRVTPLMTRESQVPEPEADTDPIHRAQHYINGNLRERLTMEEVARLVFMSRSLFARRFAATTGQTFNEYVTRCRLEEAKRLLLNTPWSVEVIATCVGLKPTRLHQIVKQHTGVSPGAYRLKFKGIDKDDSESE